MTFQHLGIFMARSGVALHNADLHIIYNSLDTGAPRDPRSTPIMDKHYGILTREERIRGGGVAKHGYHV